MNVLLDECLDRHLAKELPDHNVKTVQEMGWSGTKNGKLLALAQEKFDVFLTVDKNLVFQQNIERFSIAVVVLYGESTLLSHLQPLMTEVAEILPRLNKGQLTKVGTN